MRRALFVWAAVLTALIIAPSPASAARVFIDPGHGGRYSNANLPSLGVYEKNVNLQLALKLRDELVAQGHTVGLSRTTDVAVELGDIPTWNYTEPTDRWAYAADGLTGIYGGIPKDDLQARCNAANAFGADIFISIHNNGAASSSAHGTESFASDEDILGIRLSRVVQNNVVDDTPLSDRGARQIDFYVVKWSHMPAILVEGSFLTNAADRAYITSYSGQMTYVRAVARSVDEFLASDPFTAVYPRIAGADRYDTAAAISRSGWAPGTSTVLLATGTDWPDALASTPLSRKLDAPLLLTRPGRLPAETAAEIARLRPREIVVLGGEAAVSSEVASEAAAAAGPSPTSIRRIGGANRYETAAMIAAEVGVGSNGRVIVASGLSPADAISIAPYAGRSLTPVLLARPSSVPTAVTDFAAARPGVWRGTIVIGGPGVISDAVAASLPSHTRVWGKDRYATNIAVIAKYHTAASVSFFVSNGNATPDSLTSAALGAKLGRAAMLVKPRSLPDETREFIENNETRIVAWTMVGGQGVLPNLHDWMLRKALN